MEIAALALLVALVLLAALFLFPRSNSKGLSSSHCSISFSDSQSVVYCVSFVGKVKQPRSNANASSLKNVRVYTMEEVSKHNTRNDCWIIVKDKVYDVTPYVEEHPGGDAILNNAGRDSTEGFYGPQHATRVFDMVDEFYIGDLKN